jgi:transcriptional regulator with XRE-family HTH domain
LPATQDRTDFDFSPEGLRARREARHISREQLALLVGRSVHSVMGWESGDRSPSSTVRPLIAAALGDGSEVDAEIQRLRAATDAVREWVDFSRRESGVPVDDLADDAAATEIAQALRSQEVVDASTA